MDDGSASSEQIYDDYLDAALAGKVEDPVEFLRRHGLDADHGLREQLAGVHELLDLESGAGPGVPADFGLPYERLGDFRIVRRLGSGGMGVVYLAEQESLGRPVALKVLRPEVAHSISAQTRFEREARAVARLRHPSIVSVHAVGEEAGVRYIAMELVPGRGLDEIVAEHVADGRLPDVAQVVRWAAEIGEALACAHEAGIVHRDVKPSNIRITPDGRALLLDFGLARNIEGHGGTVTQSFLGSPAYAAPELIEAHGDADERVDVYGLGIVLYECLSGRAPFGGETIEALMHSVLTQEPPPLRRRGGKLPRDLETVIATALEKSPRRRYPSAAACAEDLRSVLAFRPIAARRRGAWGRSLRWMRRHRPTAVGVAIAFVSMLAAAGFLLERTMAEERARRSRMDQALVQADAVLRQAQVRLGETQQEEVEHGRLLDRIGEAHMTEEEVQRLEELGSRTMRHRMERERAFFEALDLIEMAERSGAPPERLGTLRAQLFRLRATESAALDHDPVAADFFTDLARSASPESTSERGLMQLQPILALEIDPPEAEIYLFALREHAAIDEGGEPRVVPVFGDDVLATDPEDWALRVVRGAGPLRVGDLVVRVAGSVVRGSVLATRDVAASESAAAGHGVRRLDRVLAVDGAAMTDGTTIRALKARIASGAAPRMVTCRVERDGTVRDELVPAAALGSALATTAELVRSAGGEARPVPITVLESAGTRTIDAPPGLDVRVTAAPKACVDGSRRSWSETGRVTLRGAQSLLVAKAPGYEDFVYRTQVAMGVLEIRMTPLGTAPEGFVHVSDGPDSRSFWIMEHEVTFRQYLAFLEDPEVQRRIDASEAPVLVPRSGSQAHVEQGADGRYAPAEGLDLDMPVFGISWIDATSYAEWRTRRAEAEGRSFEFGLPTRAEWAAAGGGGWGRPYVWGQQFRQHFASSCFARETPFPETVMSYPIDESPYGIYDLSGSVSEWLDEWWLEDRGLRTAAGGSWAHADPEMFRIFGGQGYREDGAYDTVGFRLVMRPREEP